jgi:hypothetical protein
MFPYVNQGLAALSIVDVETGYGGTTLVTKKGGTDRFAVAYCLSVLNELGYTDLILRRTARAVSWTWQRLLRDRFEAQHKCGPHPSAAKAVTAALSASISLPRVSRGL